MKAKLLTTIICVFAVSTLFAQRSSIKFGPKAGLDVVSSTRSLESLQGQIKGNYQLGGFVRIGDRFHFQPEAYYAQYFNDRDRSASYLKLPAMLGFEIADLGVATVRAQAGGTYIKQLASDGQGNFSWQIGAGTDVLGFITADLRYTLNNASVRKQWNDFVTYGGVLNLTIGVIF
jgi:hypothetical protein